MLWHCEGRQLHIICGIASMDSYISCDTTSGNSPMSYNAVKPSATENSNCTKCVTELK